MCIRSIIYLPFNSVHFRSATDLREDSINEPWSSHCNLATCEATGDSVTVQKVMRNSCTQTATNTTGAYSKTGGEIVTAYRTRRHRTKQVAVGVQTLHRKASLTPVTTESDARDTRRTNSSNVTYMPFQGNSKYRDQACQKHIAQQVVQHTCARCNQNSSDTNQARKGLQGDAPVVSQQTQTNQTDVSDNNTSTTGLAHHRVSVQSNGIQYKQQKEAKNQINASKSKCSCARGVSPSANDSVNDKYGSSVVETKRNECYKRTLFTTCPLCSKQKSVVEVSDVASSCGVCQKNSTCAHDSNSEDGKTRICVNAREHDGVLNADDADRRIVVSKSRQNCNAEGQSRRALNYNEQNGTGKFCECTNDCAACRNPGAVAETSCECRSSGQIDDNGLCHFECRLKIAERQPQKQIYSDNSQDSDTITQQHRVQSSLRCDEACSCGNQVRDIVRGQACKNYMSKPNFKVDDSSINRTEKNCQHCRSCGAMYQNAKKCGCRQTYPKAVAYELSFTKESISKRETSDIVQTTSKVPLSTKQSLDTTKSDACSCNVATKRNGPSKNPRQSRTLQVKILRNKILDLNNFYL